MKKILLLLIGLVVGLAIGFNLPRGAGLVATLASIGASPAEDYSRLESHQAFLDLQAAVDEGRKMVLRDARTEQEAIEGMRWLLRVLAMSSEVAGDSNPSLPHFQRMDTHVRKVGGDNPDAEYLHAQIDGKHDYIITGNIGTVRYLGVTVNAGLGWSQRRQVGYLSDQTMTVDEQGNFTILLTKNKPDVPGDWIQIPDDASGVLVRQYIADRSEEALPTMDIRVFGETLPFAPPSDDAVANALKGAAFSFFGLSNLHTLVFPELLEVHNEFFKATSEILGGDISGADNLYMLGSYQLADDEALVIRAKPPETRYWNLVLETRWHEILDHRYRPVSLTLEGAEYNDDGSVEFIVSHQDPGRPNWLYTSGHNFGFMTLRWLDGKYDEVDLPETEVVKFDSL